MQRFKEAFMLMHDLSFSSLTFGAFQHKAACLPSAPCRASAAAAKKARPGKQELPLHKETSTGWGGSSVRDIL